MHIGYHDDNDDNDDDNDDDDDDNDNGANDDNEDIVTFAVTRHDPQPPCPQEILVPVR